MDSKRTTTGLLLLVVAAFVGYLILSVPPWLVEQYDRFAAKGPIWAKVYLATLVVGGTLLLGSTLRIVWRLWRATRRKAKYKQLRGKNPSEMTRQQQENEIEQNLAVVDELRRDTQANDDVLRELEPLASHLDEKCKEQTLEIVAFGTISSGKSSLLNMLAGRDVFHTDPKGGTTSQRNEIPWPGMDKVTLVDTPGLGEIDGQQRANVAAQAAQDADLVLVVVDGPLRQSEFQLLEQLGEMEKRIIICLNKSDWYEPHDQEALLAQIHDQVHAFVQRKDVVAVMTSPIHRQRVRVLADGSEVTDCIDVQPDITELAERMMHVIRRDGRDLLLANLLLQSRGVVDQAKRRVEAALDKTAWEIVDRYMWGAGGVAALSPFPLVDLAAGCAVSTKMVVDLARVYKQDVDLNIAVNLLGQLGKNLLAILGATAATPAVASVVASLLKTVPGVGTIAGGLLQGVVQAIVTRWIGGVFIHHFKHEMQDSERGLAEVARREWQRITSIDELRKLVQTARQKFPSDAQASLDQ